jgi:tRNA threonylcarbamoyladenosine biosynthesis protein TsaB
MILLLDTATPVCRLWLIEGEDTYDTSWEANRELAKGLLGFIEQELSGQGKTFADLTAIGAFKGPGSFTGLRIGLTVLNTLADALSLPIVGETGDDWRAGVLGRIERGENDQIVLPLYGSEAHITTPRK